MKKGTQLSDIDSKEERPTEKAEFKFTPWSDLPNSRKKIKAKQYFKAALRFSQSEEIKNECFRQLKL